MQLSLKHRRRLKKEAESLNDYKITKQFKHVVPNEKSTNKMKKMPLPFKKILIILGIDKY